MGSDENEQEPSLARTLWGEIPVNLSLWIVRHLIELVIKIHQDLDSPVGQGLCNGFHHLCQEMLRYVQPREKPVNMDSTWDQLEYATMHAPGPAP